MKKSKRVVITGMGVVSPIGIGKDEFLKSLKEGRNGISEISLFDPDKFENFPVRIAGEIRNFDYRKYLDPTSKELRRYDRFLHFALIAAKEAVEDAKLDELDEKEKEKVGVLVSSGIGGFTTLDREYEVFTRKGPRRVSPFLIPMMIPDMAAGVVSIAHGFKGPNFCINSACASSSHALADAFNLIQLGISDVVLAGGSEATLVPMAIAAFANMGALSRRNDLTASRPFDKERDGFVMGEGAGVLVVESEEHALKRGAKIYAEFKGYGMSGDAYHITAPDPEGRGGELALRRAMETANLKPEDIDYVNCHATSTPVGDKAEIRALKRVLEKRIYEIPVNSTKSMTGHLLGAAGAVEVVASILCMNNSFVHPTINLEDPDDEFEGINFVMGESQNWEMRNFISDSFGFGGHSVSLIFGKYE